ncbi:MAG: Hsp20/alpha crystallin family protein [Halanaerobiales bacterium]
MFDLVPFNRKNKGLMDRDFFSDFFNNFGSLQETSLNQFKVDIKEDDNIYLIQAELPGVDKDNIDIELNDDYMTISAVNEEIIEEEKENYIRKERRTGKFQRCFNIKNVNTEEIDAKYEDGILEVKLPKTNVENRVRKINIQ